MLVIFKSTPSGASPPRCSTGISRSGRRRTTSPARTATSAPSDPGRRARRRGRRARLPPAPQRRPLVARGPRGSGWRPSTRARFHARGLAAAAAAASDAGWRVVDGGRDDAASHAAAKQLANAAAFWTWSGRWKRVFVLLSREQGWFVF